MAVTAASFEQQEAFVRRVLFARRLRQERSGAAKSRATVGIALAMLRDGVFPTKQNASKYSDLSRIDMWLLSVSWALAYVGAKPAYVMQERLLNREKSPESSWRAISEVLEVPKTDAQQMYVSAIPIFVAILEVREIRENVDDIDAILDVIAAPYRCAAREAGEECAMPTPEDAQQKVA